MGEECEGVGEMKGSPGGKEVKEVQNREMALKMALEEYRILAQAVGTANTAAYAVAGIFTGGLFAASAMLIPNLVHQDCGWRLCGYLLVAVVIVACMQFWFWGIHLRWRVVTAIMYQRLEELEKQLNFKAHGRIHLLYRSESPEFQWPDGEEREWYGSLVERLGRLRPCRGGMNCWWFAIVSTITAAHIITWLFAIRSCVWSFLQYILLSIL